MGKYLGYLLISLLFFNFENALAQKILKIEYQASGSYSSFKTQFPKSFFSPRTVGAFNPGAGVVAYYHLNKQFGVYSGIQVELTKFDFSIDSISENFSSYDSEEMPYRRNVYGASIKEKTNLILVNVPIRFFYNYPITRDIIITATIGPGISIPVKKDMEGEGIFTYTGLYPNLDNVILTDILPYGFSSDVNVNEKQKLKSNPIIINAGASVGISFSLSRRTKFQTTLGYQRTLTGFMPKEKRSGYHVSNELGSYYSLLSLNKGFINSFFFSAGFQKVIMF